MEMERMVGAEAAQAIQELTQEAWQRLVKDIVAQTPCMLTAGIGAVAEEAALVRKGTWELAQVLLLSRGPMGKKVYPRISQASLPGTRGMNGVTSLFNFSRMDVMLMIHV